MSYEKSTIEGKIESIGGTIGMNKVNAPTLISPEGLYLTQIYLKTAKDTENNSTEVVIYNELPEEYYNMKPEELSKNTMKVIKSEYIHKGVKRIIKKVYINDKLMPRVPIYLREDNTDIKE